MAKVGTSNPDRTISLKRVQCVVENKQTNTLLNKLTLNNGDEVKLDRFVCC